MGAIFLINFIYAIRKTKKLFLKIQFIALTIVLYTIATALIFLTENTFEYFDIYFVNPLALNQVKANMGGLLIFADTIPIMWLKTKKDYWLQTFMYILFFVIFARTISFFTDGFSLSDRISMVW